MTLRLTGDTSGFTEIKAADAAGDNSIKLPAANGGANQLLQNGGTAGELQYTSAGGGLYYDSDGRLLLGTSTGTSNITLKLQGHSGDASQDAKLRLCRGNDNPSDGNQLGAVFFSDSSESPSSSIICTRDGATWSEISKPGALKFSTTSNGSTSTTARVEIGSDGALKLLAGCPGIDFSGTNPAGATSYSETLGVYESGTWTPELADALSGGNTASVGTVIGAYTRIGDIVHLQARTTFIDTSGMTGTSQLYVRNFPYAIRSTGSGSIYIGSAQPVNFNVPNGTNVIGCVFFVNASTDNQIGGRVFRSIDNAGHEAVLVNMINQSGGTNELFIDITAPCV